MIENVGDYSHGGIFLYFINDFYDFIIYNVIRYIEGEMAERSKAAVLKTVEG